MPANPLQPDTQLLAKLGSIIRHAEESLKGNRTPVDIRAAITGIEDPQVQEWLGAMDGLALLPVLR